MSVPKQLDSALYTLVHNENVATFNQERPPQGLIDYCGGDFRGLDLRATRLEGASHALGRLSSSSSSP
ncbi:hypothetical protein [Pseudomonas sp. R5(2019)]|uniref:hypothetical protein n=1 Tax=Pseudomonas sp. R5(2019) TaxID=2697566 RepID=UPI00141331E1|nr:hypothetical protein [Pseudomonas sp. R5(2019)]NBA98205.1 hypothetical protein [Pseudomonas sp. R5(2019)]